jgi:sigma-54 dependent transcriptional regulator, acetoin dehydrogenase operon transcriptional activator AcoR
MILLEHAGATDPAATRRAWEEFVRTGKPESQGEHQQRDSQLITQSVRPHVLRAWQRAAAAGCDPRMPTAQSMTPLETLALLEREDRLLAAARPYLAALSRAAGGAYHAAMLADYQGHVLAVIGDETTIHGAESVPGPGALMSEACVGANGLGTSLAEAGYVEIVGPEHYIEGFHGYTCQGIPVLGVSGQIAGALSISLPGLATATRVRDILFCASQGIECDLLSRELLETVVRTRHTADSGVAERLRQDIVQHLAAARLKLELAAQRLARGGDIAMLVQAAEELTIRFRQRAELWRDLVTDAVTAPGPIRLDDLVAQMLALLATEASINELTLTWGSQQDAAVIMSDRHRAGRKILAEILTGMQRVGRGGMLQIEVSTAPDRRLGTVALHGQAANSEAVPPVQLTFPLVY